MVHKKRQPGTYKHPLTYMALGKMFYSVIVVILLIFYLVPISICMTTTSYNF